MMTPRHRAALIGCGDISAVHLAGILACGSELVALCDTDPARLAAAAPALTAIERVSDHRALLGRDDVDVVHVVTPHDQHVPVALDFIGQRTPVLIEKPLAASLAEAERLVAATASAGARVGVTYQNRYNATSRAAKELITSGRFGRVTQALGRVLWHRTADYYRARPWRGTWDGSGGGVLINQAIHTIDLVQWLVGDVVDATGMWGTYGLADTIEVEDTATVAMTHASGVRSVLLATNLNPTNDPPMIEIALEGGTLRLGHELVITAADGTTETITESRTATGARSYWGASHGDLIADFHRDLTGEFWINPAEAYKSLWILKQVLGR
ncbi:MAG: Gfo/Idh/MocA family oxidoreductase [Propionibacteriales bacterium]|nr:Gfo/Idh/MocA family oxidoreductase [Propionibacteriales bacterium]